MESYSFYGDCSKAKLCVSLVRSLFGSEFSVGK